MAHVFGSSLGLQIWDYVDRILIIQDIQDIWGQDFKARAVHLQQKASEEEVLNYVYPVALPNYSNLPRFFTRESEYLNISALGGFNMNPQS